ncbi:hypothetical protein [Lysobacter sp. CA199]|uniref:hypothetical protein n=1 Tax=Lysobacter sp. CA199 TaxID=3455608 RepID=UPI003F8D04D7
MIDQIPTVPLPQVQALSPDDLAPQQARLREGARRLLDGRFTIASQRLFVLDETGADWVSVQNFVGGHIEKQWQGQWLDAPASNEDVHARVWRSGQPSGYVALIRLDDRSGSRRLVFGYFALTKTVGAPEDRPNPKAALFGQAPSGN